MEQCPEGSPNRTDCLLQAILEASSQADYNWDPITFGFTAGIGVLAVVVAIITVFQALLAAGPGRIKASIYAVGNFAAESRSRFDPFEMAVRTKAYVPFFSWDLFKEKLAALVREKQKLELKRDPEGIKDHSATWLAILGRLKLDNPDFWYLIPRATDYLPSDIYAAPAAAEVRCLALLAVLADDHSEAIVEDRFVEVHGTTSQLSFRDHPVAGKVAAFDDFCISTTRSGLAPSGTTPSSADVFPLLNAAELIEGHVRSNEDEVCNLVRPYGSTLRQMFQPFGRADGCDHAWCREVHSMAQTDMINKCQHSPLKKMMATSIALLDYPAPLWARGFPSKRLQVEEILDTIWGTTPGWKTDPDVVMELFQEAAHGYGLPTPMRQFYAFWMEKGRHINHTRTSRTGEAWWAAKQGNEFNSEEAPWRRINNPHGGCISEDILTSVNDWMLDVGDIGDVDSVDIVLREYILHQLQDLCTWMENQPGAPWKCATRAILYRIWHQNYDDLSDPNGRTPTFPPTANGMTSSTRSQPLRQQRHNQSIPPGTKTQVTFQTTKVDDGARSNMPRQTASVTNLDDLKQEPFVVTRRRAQTEPVLAHAPMVNTSDSKAMDGLQAIVAYRALLFGIFLMLCTDTSVFVDMSGVGHVESIVKVL